MQKLHLECNFDQKLLRKLEIVIKVLKSYVWPSLVTKNFYKLFIIMKSFNLLTPTNGADDWNFKENEVGFLF